MIFVNHFSSGPAAKDYHPHLSQGDGREYHGKDAKMLRPIYEGQAAEIMGIADKEADRESFSKLIDNIHPTKGNRITARTKDERRAMTDVTFDVPKSVSLAAIVDGRVYKAIDEAVSETVKDMEKAMAVRVRKGGQDTDRITGNALYVKWWHDTSRPLADGTSDPQRHCHVTFLNLSRDNVEGVFKACQWVGIVANKGWFQGAYHARLGAKLTALGYGVEKDGTSFKLSGIDRALCDKFSRRHAVIAEAAEKLGTNDPKIKARLARTTRKRKGDELGNSALRAEWIGRMTDDEFERLKVAGTGIYKTPRITAQESVGYAKADCFERNSCVSEMRLKAVALQHGVGSVLPDKVDEVVAKDRDLIRVKRDGQVMVTTHQVLRDELEMLRLAREGHGKCRPFGIREDAVANWDGEGPAACRHVLGSRDWVTGVRGGPGTGKTTFLKRLVPAIEHGCDNPAKVYLFAQSSDASRGTLAEAGFKDAQTLKTLLVSEKLQKEIRGQVIIVDEAGLNGTKDLSELLRVAKEQQVKRVILVGDYLQHRGVDRGEPFRILESEAGVKYARLTTVRRQKEPGYRAVAQEVSKGTKGSALKAFNMLDKMGCVHEAVGDERHKALVNDYLKSVDEGKTGLIVVPTLAGGRRLTEELRERLKERLEITGKERQYVIRTGTKWTAAEKQDARGYQEGMIVEVGQNIPGLKVKRNGRVEAIGGLTKGEICVVKGVVAGRVEITRQNGANAVLPLAAAERFEVYRKDRIEVGKGERLRVTKNGWLKNAKGKNVRVNNGDILTVEGFTKDGDIKVGGGRVLPKTWGHFKHGYVSTSRGGQSKTLDRQFIGLGNESFGAANLREWLVDVTRGVDSCKVYVDSKADAKRAIQRSDTDIAAVELVKGTRWEQKHRQTMRDRLKEMLERNRVVRYWKSRAESLSKTWANRVGREREGVRRHG